MTRQPPAERTLPNKQQILDQVLADTRADHRNQPDQPARKRPAWLVPVIAAAAVAAVIGAAIALPQTNKSGDPAVSPATKPAEPETNLDIGTLTQAQIAKIFEVCRPWEKPYTVLHATKIRTGWGNGEDWTVAVKGHDPGGNGIPAGDGRLTACSGYPVAKPAGETLTDRGFRLNDFWTTTAPAPSEEELANLPKGESFFQPKYDDSFRPIEGFGLEAQPDQKWATPLWVKVPEQVDRVRQRLVIDGKPGQWFSSKAVDGMSFTQGWVDAPIKKTATFTLEVQFLDKANQPVEIPGSTGPTTVLTCSGQQFNKTYDMAKYYVS